MAIFEVSLNPKDMQDNSNTSFTIYNVADDSVERVKRLIMEYYPGVVEDSIETFCLESGAVYRAVFTTVDKESGKKLRWNAVETNHIMTV